MPGAASADLSAAQGGIHLWKIVIYPIAINDRMSQLLSYHGVIKVYLCKALLQHEEVPPLCMCMGHIH